MKKSDSFFGLLQKGQSLLMPLIFGPWGAQWPHYMMRYQPPLTYCVFHHIYGEFQGKLSFEKS